MDDEQPSVDSNNPMSDQLSANKELNECWKLIYREDKKCKINLANLFKLLMKYQDIPVMCISIAGPQRSGKSFLLNLLILYLESKMDSVPSNWLDDLEKTIPTHFEWTNSTEPKTEGILFWNKCYEITTEKSQKVAVMLMDTEGAFARDTDADSPLMFAFSTLLSSLQIYNLKGIIDECNLTPLCTFSNFISKIIEQDPQSQKRFLDNCDEFNGLGEPEMFSNKLMFLIRDIQPNDDYELGVKGGCEYVEKKLQLNELHHSNNARHFIKHLFSTIEGCLLPFPSFVIGNSPTPGQMKLSDLGTPFLEKITNFFHHLFCIEQTKQRMYTGSQILKFAQTFSNVLDEKVKAKPDTMIQVLVNMNVRNISEELLFHYKQKIEEDFKEFPKDQDIEKSHSETKDQVLREFNHRCSVYAGIEELSKIFEEEIENQFEILKEKRTERQRDQVNTSVHESFTLYKNEFSDTEENYEEASCSARDNLHKKHCDDKEVLTKALVELEKQMQDHHEQFLLICSRVKSFPQCQKESIDLFKLKMKEIYGKYVPEEEINLYVNEQKNYTIQYFYKKIEETNPIGDFTEGVNELQESINQLSNEAKCRNNDMKKLIESRVRRYAIEVRSKFGEFISKVTKNCYLLPGKLESLKKKYWQEQKKEITEKIPKDHFLYKMVTKKVKQYIEKEFTKRMIIIVERKSIHSSIPFHSELSSFWDKIEPLMKNHIVPAVLKIVLQKATDYVKEKLGLPLRDQETLNAVRPCTADTIDPCI